MWQRVPTGWYDRPPGHPRLRVVVESAKPVDGIADFSRYADAGLDVALCPGPGDDVHGCPLVRGEHCPLVDEADVVLSALGEGPVLDALAARHDGTAVVVVVDDPLARVPAGCGALPSTWPVGAQIRVLRSAGVEGRSA